RPLRPHPHLQLPAGPRDRPPHQPHALQDRPGHGRRPGGAHRCARGRAPGRAARGACGERLMLTLKAALEEATAAIGKVDAQAIFTHLLGVDRAYLVANPMRVLTETEDARIDTLVARRSMGHPVAYLLGRREFYSREFGVGPDVLIPRPETETLVEQALLRVGSHGRCLDLGTGSGAIAVTLACERPGLTVTATDTSAAALAVARSNAAALGCAGRIDFRQGEWYAPVAGERFELVVANPPYVAAGDAHLAQGDLRFEPAGALTDGSAD